jgi:hypothetical protein
MSLTAALASVASADVPDLHFGAGVTGFVDGDSRDTASTGAEWHARIVYPVLPPFAIETAYVGSYQEMDSLGLDRDAHLINTTLEATVRWDMLHRKVRPYLFAGIGWSRFDITNADYNTSDIRDSDNLASFPLGGGVEYRLSELIFDARGTYRATAGADLMTTGNETWSVTFSVGIRRP